MTEGQSYNQSLFLPLLPRSLPTNCPANLAVTRSQRLKLVVRLRSFLVLEATRL